MDRGAWWAAVHGVSKSQTWLSYCTFTFHFYALEKEMATHSSVLAWRIPGMGLHRVRHDWSDLAVVVAAVPELALCLLASLSDSVLPRTVLILSLSYPIQGAPFTSDSTAWKSCSVQLSRSFNCFSGFFAPNYPFNFWLFFTVSKDLHCLKNNLCRNSYFTSQRNTSWKKFLKVPALASKAWVRSRLL